MRSVCVFCGANAGRKQKFARAARETARALVDHGLTIVYGGGSVGMMGILADAALEAGGKVVGVLPGQLHRKEMAHAGLTQLHIVGSMHERKALMAELSDGFIALPGGLGTLEELFEVLSWAQLGLHAKPCGLLNIGGYFNKLNAFLELAVAERFLRREHRSLLLIDTDVERLLRRFARFRPARLRRWIGPRQA
ncbi:MAG: TIGR00730 family Rossman fold protein [Gammaproteobacteria bacterium]|nr:TIGR00730 family Rossman fold protein [Gammaproteobacteria bacterium]